MPPSPTPVATNLELRDYMTILRRRKALIALVTAVVVLVTVGYSLTRTPMYEARAQVLIDRRESDAILGILPASDNDATAAKRASS